MADPNKKTGIFAFVKKAKKLFEEFWSNLTVSNKNNNKDDDFLDLNAPGVLGATNPKKSDHDKNKEKDTKKFLNKSQKETIKKASEGLKGLDWSKKDTNIPKAIKGVAKALDEVLAKETKKENALAKDIQAKVAAVQDIARDMSSDQQKFQKFKDAVLDLKNYTQEFKKGPKDATSYLLANFSDQLNQELNKNLFSSEKKPGPHSLSSENSKAASAVVANIKKLSESLRKGKVIQPKKMRAAPIQGASL